MQAVSHLNLLIPQFDGKEKHRTRNNKTEVAKAPMLFIFNRGSLRATFNVLQHAHRGWFLLTAKVSTEFLSSDSEMHDEFRHWFPFTCMHQGSDFQSLIIVVRLSQILSNVCSYLVELRNFPHLGRLFTFCFIYSFIYLFFLFSFQSIVTHCLMFCLPAVEKCGCQGDRQETGRHQGSSGTEAYASEGRCTLS